MKYAVIHTGGKQYKVAEGDIIQVEKIPKAEGEEIVFEDVRLTRDNNRINIGTPQVTKAKVVGKIIQQTKSKKVIIFKMKRRKGYHRKTGHRQPITRIEIKEIKI